MLLKGSDNRKCSSNKRQKPGTRHKAQGTRHKARSTRHKQANIRRILSEISKRDKCHCVSVYMCVCASRHGQAGMPDGCQIVKASDELQLGEDSVGENAAARRAGAG